MNKDVYILAIESSCDETAAAVIKNGREILSNVINTQIEIHKEFGGVVPEVASRKHIENVTDVINKAIEDSGKSVEEIDAVAVTYGPGLVGALLVGLNAAKAVAYAWKKPLIGVNHIEGHISANYLMENRLEPPFICLVVSGGHTHVVHVEDYGKFNVLGRTRDDACGEAYDKVARALGLGYPGGPKIDRLAKEGNKNAIEFPRVKLENNSLDFSFSGLKSAVLNYLNQSKQKNIEIVDADVAASFQEACVDVLVDKTVTAAKLHGCEKIALAGGVAANSRLRQAMQDVCSENNYEFYMPDIKLCTDNAAMIASRAYYMFLDGEFSEFDLNAYPNLEIGK